MIYKYEECDLFCVPSNYYLVQCISADFAMGAGIAVQFNKNHCNRMWHFICVDTSCTGVVAENRKAALHRKTLSASLAEGRGCRKRTGEE